MLFVGVVGGGGGGVGGGGGGGVGGGGGGSGGGDVVLIVVFFFFQQTRNRIGERTLDHLLSQVTFLAECFWSEVKTKLMRGVEGGGGGRRGGGIGTDWLNMEISVPAHLGVDFKHERDF